MCSGEISIRRRLTFVEVFSRKHSIEKLFEHGVLVVHVFHLGFIGTRYYSGFYTILLQLFQEVYKTVYVYVRHLLLVGVQSACYLRLLVGLSGKIVIVNLG